MPVIELTLSEAKCEVVHEIKLNLMYPPVISLIENLMKKNMSQRELADMLNLTRSQISRAIKGGTNPSDIEVRKKIYRVLGMV